MFEHIFINFLQSKIDYLEQMAKNYFLEIAFTHRIQEIFYNYDHIGSIRLLPLILQLKNSDK
jgi:hypothetical protein